LYVLEVLEETNTVVVGTEDKLYHNALIADSVSLIAYSEEDFTDKRLFTVKIRYKDKGDLGTCFLNEDGNLEIHFDQPRSAITPGQSVVLYDGDIVVGGGIIKTWFDV
jgi:tRNA-specific 2-thiouridylase